MGTLAVFGDSVAWGQGLSEVHKFSTIVADSLTEAGNPTTVSMNAHSGATIGLGDAVVQAPIGPEVPNSYPTIWEQVQNFSPNPADVKWVLINGGINDVDVRSILNPLYFQAELDVETKTYCESHMRLLLKAVGARFPSASVYVVGYYPILSYASNPLGIEALFSIHHGINFSPLLDRNLLRNAIVDHCLRFWRYSTLCLQQAVNEVNAEEQIKRFSYVDTGFDEQNAVYAPEALLWPVELTADFSAIDEVTVERCAECDEARQDAITRFICYRASAGHPDVAGANQIASRITAAMNLTALRVTSNSDCTPVYIRTEAGVIKSKGRKIRSMSRKITIDPVVASRIKAAWAQLPPEKQAKLAPALMAANRQAVLVSQTGQAPLAPAAPHQLTLAYSALSADSDAVVGNLESGAVVDVGPDGVIWGTGKWEQLDPGWVEAFAVFLESLLPLVGGKHPFNTNPQTIQIPNEVQIALAGDWGTGDWRTVANPAPSTDVRKHMDLLKPDITIHLGDVYYAGTSGEETHLLVQLWPKGRIGSFALNSNHEMYSGAKPYFAAISSPPFSQQAGCSYFALENDNWVIVALDSAYFASEDTLYIDGLLFPQNHPNSQNSFLQQKAADAQLKNKRVIVLTHHNGLDETGSTPNLLFEQVLAAFPADFGPSHWYWGHLHAGAAYKPTAVRQILCRCCGHGALPWGHSSNLANSSQVDWYENRFANDPDIPERVFNGFAVLTLDGPAIVETFFDENGGVAWKKP